MAKATFLTQLIESYNLNNFRFEQEIKAANGSISKLINSGSEISENLINKIVLRYPEVNPEWLRTGKGSMKHKQDPKRKILLSKIEDIERIIAELQRQITEVKKIL